MANLEGKQIRAYRLTKRIGGGYFGDVYLAEHIRDKTLVAIKVLKVQTDEKHFLKRFIDEADNILRLAKHPHIVKLRGLGLEDDIPFLVMEYAAGGTLRQRHPHGSHLSLDLIITYVKQIAAALQYAHDQELVHRDIKPENILLGEQGEAMVSDFGIATLPFSLVQSPQDMAGTIPYMAPEQIRKKAVRASDQYALGIIVYEWISGSWPFQGTFEEIAAQHINAPPPSLRKKIPTITADVEQVVMKALAKEPQQRYMSVQEFALALEEVYKKQGMRQQIQVIGGKTKRQWLNEGYAHNKAKRYQEAVAAYSQAIALDPSYVDAYVNRGIAYRNLQEYQKAIADYDRAIALNPNYARAYHNRGYAYVDLQEYQKAIADYNRTIALNPNYARVYVNRGIAYRDLQEYQKAIVDFDRAIVLNPNDARAYNNRGYTYQLLKLYQRAIEDYDRALAIDPNHSQARTHREKASQLLKG
jgi:tetratricopeptide (TPR) repeat protein